MAGFVENYQYWRRRAEEARRIADTLDDAIAKRLMHEVADSYQRIAEIVEAKPNIPSTTGKKDE